MSSKKNTIKLVFPVFLAALVAGMSCLSCCYDCFNDPEHPDPLFDASLYFPMKEGLRWFYVCDEDSEWQIQHIVDDTLVILEDDTVFEWLRSSSAGFPYVADFTGYFRTSNDTVYRTNEAYLRLYSGEGETPYQHFRRLNPDMPGDSLNMGLDSVFNSPGLWGQYYWLIMNDTTDVETPMGTFVDCLALEYYLNWMTRDSLVLLAEECYSLDTGLVFFREYPFSRQPGDLGDSVITFRLKHVYFND